MAEFNIPSDDDFEDDVETLDKQMLFERRKELLTQSQVSQPKKDNPTISTAVSSARATGNAAADSTRLVDQTQLSNSKPFADDGKVTVSTKLTADRPNTSAEPFIAGSAAVSGAYAGYRILVNRKQKGNPILKFVRNVPWEFDNIIPDYDLGRCACALYLSVKYHNRFPEYIHNRLKELGKSYELRILLVQVDTKQQDISHELNQLAKICILADCTMILAFSLEEAGRYLELYKAYENKPPTDIMGRTKHDFLSQATEFLTSVKGVNKTDVTTLLSKFKTLKGIIEADVESLSMCAGIGPVKARRIINTFTTPFLRKTSSPQKHSITHTAASVDDMINELADDSDLDT